LIIPGQFKNPNVFACREPYVVRQGTTHNPNPLHELPGCFGIRHQSAPFPIFMPCWPGFPCPPCPQGFGFFFDGIGGQRFQTERRMTEGREKLP
jgi:hypothetical protein